MNDANMTLPLFNQHYPRGSEAFLSLVKQQVSDALIEDIGTGDLTVSLIPKTQDANATIIVKENAILCGIDWANACFQALDKNSQVKWHANEGDHIKQNQVLCEIKGNARALLSAERCALNFLQMLSAVATHTSEYVKLIANTKAKILDTRKTIPGLRLAQKYAVTVGGGHNQRLALYDGILIKENHIMAAGSIAAALQHAFQIKTKASIQIEVENLNELQQSLEAGATNILLDDFSLNDLQKAVEINQQKALLEASGNVNLNTILNIANTGVDRISIGALTKNIRAIDLSMRIQ